MILDYKLWEASYDNDNGDSFWGNTGAGVLIICKSTKRILLNLRSQFVNEPLTWGIFGGKIDNYENPKEAVLRELKEETKYKGNIKLIDSFIYKTKNNSFIYYNYIGIVNNEFTPILDWESKDFKWFTYEELIHLKNKHFGLIELLKNENIKKYI